MEYTEQIALISRLMKTPLEEVQARAKPMEDGILYYGADFRGGGAILVGRDGTVLFAASAVPPKKHLEAFRQGIRTPLEAFKS